MMRGKKDEEVDMAEATTTTPEGLTSQRAKRNTDLMWHVAVFVIINGFFWTLDILTGGGVTWAFWITLMWGLALAFHVAATLIGSRGAQ
jgi:hypothetical protein